MLGLEEKIVTPKWFFVFIFVFCPDGVCNPAREADNQQVLREIISHTADKCCEGPVHSREPTTVSLT